jgi:hypothetical protein
MEAMVDGGGNGFFATVINTNYGMVAAASTTTAQLMTTTTIAAATIGQRRHCHGCHCIIVSPSHRRLRQRQPLLTKTIAVTVIDCRFHQQ